MKDIYTIREAADKLGYTVKTLQRWDREGRLVPVSRTETNRRVYTEEQLNNFLRLEPKQKPPSRIIAYCRVSSPNQKPDLVNQRSVLEDFCVARGFAGVEFMEETGGGLNFQRKKFLAVMEAIDRFEVKTLVIAHKDRLVRFGYEWFEYYAKRHGCEILVLNQERLSPEHEMVQDLMTIVNCFSSRLYGLRNYRKKLKEAMEADRETSIQDRTEDD